MSSVGDDLPASAGGDPSSSGSLSPDTIREDQVQNAVAFLSHPKVRASPESSKREFLERKGLTAGEIAQAFVRVPSPPPSPSAPAAAPAAIAAELPPVPSPSPPEAPRWPQMLMGAGLAAGTLYALKVLLWPSISDSVDAWRGKSRPDGETAPSEASARALADAISEQTSELRGAVKALQDAAERLSASESRESKAGDAALSLGDLRSELRALAAVLKENDALPIKELQSDLKEVRALLAQAQDSDASPEPASRASPSAAGDDPGARARRAFGAEAAEPEDADRAPHPPSYMQVLEMLEKGETPPGIRSDIDDKAPDPEAAPPPAKLAPRPKPWEAARAASKGKEPLAEDFSESSGGGGSLRAGFERVEGAEPSGPDALENGAVLSAFAAGPPSEYDALSALAAEAEAEEESGKSSAVRADPLVAEVPAPPFLQPAHSAPRSQASSASLADSSASPLRMGRRAPASIFDAATAPTPMHGGVIANRLAPGLDAGQGSGFSSAAIDAVLGLPPPEGGSGAAKAWKPPPMPTPSLGNSTRS